MDNEKYITDCIERYREQKEGLFDALVNKILHYLVRHPELLKIRPTLKSIWYLSPKVGKDEIYISIDLDDKTLFASSSEFNITYSKEELPVIESVIEEWSKLYNPVINDK